LKQIERLLRCNLPVRALPEDLPVPTASPAESLENAEGMARPQHRQSRRNRQPVRSGNVTNENSQHPNASQGSSKRVMSRNSQTEIRHDNHDPRDQWFGAQRTGQGGRQTHAGQQQKHKRHKPHHRSSQPEYANRNPARSGGEGDNFLGKISKGIGRLFNR
ncbi:MAG TPA: hypothetical protein VLM37_00260, partial [Fibrobacteraceae bacterium]|nr:hypothetical protein [Fibrobacteraceae bacterium]